MPVKEEMLMFRGLGLFSIICTGVQLVKDACTPVIPAENWANKDLIHEDTMKGISSKQFQRNLANGKYKMAATYPEPHRDKDGKIIIENCQLYKEDLIEHGSVQTMRWVKEGKYNLNPEENKIEELRIKKKFDYLYAIGESSKEKFCQEEMKQIIEAFDYKNASGVVTWRKADAVVKAYDQKMRDVQF